MRLRFAGCLVALTLVVPVPQQAQQTAVAVAPSTQPSTLLNQALSALAGSVVLSDVTLSGTANSIAGSDNESGTVTYKALGGASRLDVTLSAGTRTEIRQNTSTGPTGSWIGPDGVSHPIASHNLIADAGLFPAFTIGTLFNSPNTVFTYIGPESKDGVSVVHISASQQFPSAASNFATVAQHLSQVEIYLDASSFLPVSYVYFTHPDNNLTIDLLTEIDYSNYQSVAGAMIPLHVQKLVNNSLTLDFNFQTTALNSGVTVSQITATN
jgi:hypothetical protein